MIFSECLKDKIEQLDFIDFSVSYGRPAVPYTGLYVEKDDLLSEMERIGIRHALAYHTLAKAYQCSCGNNRLTEEASDDAALLLSWVVVPNEDEMGCSPSELVAAMKRQNVRAVRLFPSSQSKPLAGTRYAFYEWFYGDFMDAFERERIPVILEFSPDRRAEPEWDKLYALGTEYPKLPIVLCDTFQRASLSLVRMLERLPNLFVQSCSIGTHRQLEYVANKVGAERIVAGSKFPTLHMGAMVGQVLFANLAYDQKKLISGDNARRILGLAREDGTP